MILISEDLERYRIPEYHVLAKKIDGQMDSVRKMSLQLRNLNE